MLYHALTPPFNAESIKMPSRAAVIVFFVISGYVIAYVTQDRESGFRRYAINRMTRLYAVVIPALLLTAILFAVGRAAELPLYEPIDHPLARIGASLLFINQSWNLTIQALNNGPFWSLCYEFWYYVVFAAVVFSRSPYRWVLAAVLLLVAGPRIALLFPVWLCGVGVFHLERRFSPGAWPGASLVFVSAVAYLTSLHWLGSPFDDVVTAFGDSLVDGFLPGTPIPVFIGSDWTFLRDYWIALVFAVVVLFSRCPLNSLAPDSTLARLVRSAAGNTFSLYLYHVPILFFVSSIAIVLHGDLPPTWLQVVITLAVVWLLARVTEHRTGDLRRWTTARLSEFESKVWPKPRQSERD